MENLTLGDKKKDVEQFFAEAFCAERATLVTETSGFKVTGVMEIECGDKRGAFYVALVEKTS